MAPVRSLLTIAILVTAASCIHAADVVESETDRLAVLLADSRYEEVLAQGSNLVADMRSVDPTGSVAEAEILDLMVNACYRSKHVMDEDAPAMASRAVGLKERLLGPDSVDLATSLMHQGNLHCRRWEGELAIPLYERAVAILARAGPKYDPQRAVVLTGEGVAYRRTGNSDQALVLYLRALSIQERTAGLPDPDLASTLNNLAMIRVEHGNYLAARRLHERALHIRESCFGLDHEWVAESLNNLASVLGYLGDYDHALQAQERAVAIFGQTLGRDHQRYWWATLNLGIAYLDMGDYAGALPICEEVLDALRQRYGDEHSETCYALDALASCCYGLEDLERALALYRTSRRIGEAAFGVGNLETADTIAQEGKCLLALGRLDEAAVQLTRSLEIREGQLDGDSPVICELLHCLAEAYCRLEQYDLAAAYARRSRDVGRRDLGANHPLLARAYFLQATIESARGEPALTDALEAETISRRHLQATMRVLSEARALDYAATRTVGLDLALSLLKRHERGPRVASVWDAVIRSRSAVLDEYTARNRELAIAADAGAAALLDSSLTVRERLANLTLRGPGWEDADLYRQMLDDAERDLEHVERELSLVSARFRRRRDSQQIGYPEVATSLADADALVAYVRYDHQHTGAATGKADIRYLALVRTGATAEPLAIDLGPATEIDRLVAAWQDQVRHGAGAGSEWSAADAVTTRGFIRVSANESHRIDTYFTVADSLARRVWRPLTAELDGASRIFVVPAGALHLVNFSALPADDQTYLVEAEPLLHMLISERSLTADALYAVSVPGLVAVGNPDFDAGFDGDDDVESTRPRPCSGVTDVEFGPLPFAQREVESIEAIWSRGLGADRCKMTILVGAEATELAFKNSLDGRQVLHLATHGFVIPDHCDSTGSRGSFRGAPLAFSGLALSGANHWQRARSGADDGILTAEEIAALDLSAVQWAVLSACDTGLGAIGANGEGIFGLRRVFVLAGARTVITSLWSVEDQAARQWMSALYEAHWIDGVTSAEAVRQASRSVLAARREAGLSTHPHHWAGFVAAGDWH